MSSAKTKAAGSKKRFAPLPSIPPDVEISQKASLKHIRDVAAQLDLTEDDLRFYGTTKAKVRDGLWERVKKRRDGKLILVAGGGPYIGNPISEQTETLANLAHLIATMQILLRTSPSF